MDKCSDIPMDYKGVMGVPVTYLCKHNPEQFKILGTSRFHDGQEFSDDIAFINGKQLYNRVLIQKVEWTQ